VSGIYIPGVEMPASCYKCGVSCNLVSHIVRNMHPFWRYEKCPLVPVPDHGRLIDASVLMEKCMKEDTFLAEMLFRKLSNAPTIIPADKEE